MRISGVTYAARKKSKKLIIFKIFLVLLLLAILSSAGLSAYTGWTITHPKRKVNSFDISKLSIPKYKDAIFADAKNTVNLKGMYFKSENSKRTIILAHGYGSNRYQFDKYTIDMVKNFLYNGYNMLLFDFRASGVSGGKVSTVGLLEQNDLLGAIKYAKNEGGEKIILLGVSMGASTSILTASGNKDVDAVIADSPFSNLESYLNENLPVWTPLPSIFNQPVLLAAQLLSGANPGKVNPINALKDLSPTPLLLIHSINDTGIPVSNSRDLYDSYKKLAGDKAELWETDASNHARSYRKYPNEYMIKVYDFLNKTVNKPQ